MTQYGFRRNVLALRRMGIAVSGLTTGACIFATIHSGLRVNDVMSLALALICLWLWAACVRPEWVREAADGYAAKFYEAVDGATHGAQEMKP